MRVARFACGRHSCRAAESRDVRALDQVSWFWLGHRVMDPDVDALWTGYLAAIVVGLVISGLTPFVGWVISGFTAEAK